MNLIVENCSPLEIVTLTIIGEGRGEPIEGQVGIGSVIRNRLQHSPHKYQSLRDVCLEPNQFSCWNLNDPNYTLMVDLGEKFLEGLPVSDPYYRQCSFVARGIMDWSLMDNTNGALFYMTNYLFRSNNRPAWAMTPKKDPVIHGKHTFFTV